MLKGAGLWFPPPFSYEYVIIGDLFSKCCGFHNSLHVCRNQAVKRPQSCGQTHPMTVAMKLTETLVKSAWEKCLTCWLDDNTYFESGWNLVAFEICLLFLCICKQQQVVFLDSHCEVADIYFILRLLETRSSLTLNLLNWVQGTAWQAGRQPVLLLRSSVCFDTHPECHPCSMCSFPCSLLICAKPGGS